jgi:hypothetical protein
MTQYIHNITFEFTTGGSIGLVTDDPVLTAEAIKQRLQDPEFLKSVLNEIDVEVADQSFLCQSNFRDSWKQSVETGTVEIEVESSEEYE